MELRQLRREALKAALRACLRWDPLREPRDGWSIVLGTPWDLRHLLDVNLRFVERTDTTGLDAVHVVFDRVEQPGGREFVAAARGRFPGLPLEFRFHEPLPGRIVRRIDQSKFYASLNWVTGIKACRTRHAVMHDFDLYPLDPAYFRTIVGAMERNGWRFGGAEVTRFSGLQEDERIIGTWNLGIDVEWIRRRWSPVDCFHAVRQFNGRRVDFDAFSGIQAVTPERGLAEGVGPQSFAHVKNLCSTYLRFRKGEAPNVAWRLHLLWYLEELSGRPEHLDAAVAAMRAATDGRLRVGDYAFDFSSVHPTCANVLRDTMATMEIALLGAVRPKVSAYADVVAEFLARHGDRRSVEELGEAWAAGML